MTSTADTTAAATGSTDTATTDSTDAATVRVNLGPRSYTIRIGTGTLPQLPGTPPLRPGLPALLVADAAVEPLAHTLAPHLGATLHRVPAGEASKSLHELSRLYDALAELPADRQTPVIALGGGVVGDLAGLAAATYNRGLPLVMLPTTLLAMVDSSVGGKVAINHPRGKNLIGAFHQPSLVWIDTDTLATLPEREYRSGLAEVVKYGAILDAALLAQIEQQIEAILARDPAVLRPLIARCCRLKADIVERDEREEHDLRALLNFGHTFAHALETVGGYGSWLHGEAVAAGMVCAMHLSERLGLTTAADRQRLTALLARLGLPTEIPADWPGEALIEAMRRDKKNRAGRLRFVLLQGGLGQASVVDGVDESVVRAVLRACTA